MILRSVTTDTADSLARGRTVRSIIHEMSGGNEKLASSLKQAIPLGRLGEPEDFAGAVAFFAPDHASFVTGQTLSVSDGLTMI
jgi:2-hydroxycyclohexanecarboxyl-CoA dehydrogenase